MQTLSQAYVQGIADTRQMWAQFERDGVADLHHARQALANTKECMAMGFAGDVQDALRGERDFLALRIKRLTEARAVHGVLA